MNLRVAQGVAAFVLIVVGLGLLAGWPVALIAAGVMLLVDRLT